MQLIFHGGAQEVGRSCVEVRTEGDRYLLDCGLKFHHEGFDYPAKVFDSRTIDALFISHAHLDHSGGLPFFEHYRLSCPIFCTLETQDMVKILLEDSHRIAQLKHICEAFTNTDLEKAYKDMRNVQFNNEKQFRNVKYTYLNAGHIPGSASIRLRSEGLTLLYTGDYNTVESQLMAAADPYAWGEVDILITEATYGDKDHPDRQMLEDAFLAKVEEVVKRGGSVLIPVFAVGRAQEILLSLSKRQWSIPIFMDGMAKKITNVIIRGQSPYVLHKNVLQKMHDMIHIVKSEKQREKAVATPGIYVTTSGMLQGGPACTYLEKLSTDPKSAVFLTGYQVERTKGWFLAEQGTVKFNGKVSKALCEVQKFDFSAHLSRPELEATIKALKPKIVIFMHGNPDAIGALLSWAKQEGFQAYAPAVGDQVDIFEGVSSQMHLYTADEGYKFPEEHQHGKPIIAFDDFESEETSTTK